MVSTTRLFVRIQGDPIPAREFVEASMYGIKALVRLLHEATPMMSNKESSVWFDVAVEDVCNVVEQVEFGHLALKCDFLLSLCY